MKKAENVLTEEVARDHLKLFTDFYDIDISNMKDKTQKNAIDETMDKIVGFIRRGLLEIKFDDGKLSVVQKLNNSDKTMPYAILSGKHKIVMDDNSNENNYTRMYQLVGSLTNLGSKAISSLTGPDLKLAEHLAVLFLVA